MNTQVTEDYCSFEVAKLLKEKGFDWECLGTYSTGDKELSISSECPYSNDLNDDMFIAAPTLQKAMKWLREQNRIISIVHGYITNKYRIIITQSNELDITNLGNTLYCSNEYDYFSYEEACEAAIKYCLENLI